MRVLLLLLFFSMCSNADEYVWKKSCDRDMRNINICAGEMFSFYEGELNRLYSEQMNYLKTKDRKALFEDAQKTWKEFRERDCTYYAGRRENSGSIWSSSYKMCLTERTKSRIKELNEFIGCRDNGCPY